MSVCVYVCVLVYVGVCVYVRERGLTKLCLFFHSGSAAVFDSLNDLLNIKAAIGLFPQNTFLVTVHSYWQNLAGVIVF